MQLGGARRGMRRGELGPSVGVARTLHMKKRPRPGPTTVLYVYDLCHLYNQASWHEPPLFETGQAVMRPGRLRWSCQESCLPELCPRRVPAAAAAQCKMKKAT